MEVSTVNSLDVGGQGTYRSKIVLWKDLQNFFLLRKAKGLEDLISAKFLSPPWEERREYVRSLFVSKER